MLLLWPNVKFPIPRHKKKNETIKTLDQYIDPVVNTLKRNIVIFDGISCSGKTTLSQYLGRVYLKLNNFVSFTKGNDYNICPMTSLYYYETYKGLLDAVSNEKNIIFDRFFFSNYIFYFVHNLMSVYRDELMPKPKLSLNNTGSCAEVQMHLNDLADRINFYKVLYSVKEFMKKYEDKIGLVFFVNSDINNLCLALHGRGGKSDVIYANTPNYNIAQFHVYSWIARHLNIPIVDLAVIFKVYKMSIPDFNLLLKLKSETNENVVVDENYNKKINDICLNFIKKNNINRDYTIFNSKFNKISNSTMFRYSMK